MSYRNYCSCINCKDKISTNNIAKHYDRCLIKGKKFIGKKFPEPQTLNCQYCNSLRINANSLRQHEIRCRMNPIGVKVKPSRGMLGKTGSNQFTKAKRLGIPIPEVSKESIAKRLQTKLKNGTLKKTQEQKNNTSIAMKRAVEKYPESYTSANRGRTKQFIIDGIKLQGQWEVDFYIWAKKENLNPQRPAVGFKYCWNGERTYYPDFYIESFNLYVEVKGYETERDRAKWSQFPKKLCIIKEKEIREIRKGSFMGL